MNIQQMFAQIGKIELDSRGNDVTKTRGTAAPRRWRGHREPQEYKALRTPRLQALAVANTVVDRMRAAGVTGEITICGSLRRQREDIGDVDIAVCGDFSNLCKNVLDTTDRAGSQLVSGVSGGLHVDLRFAPAENFGALVLHLTGSRAFNISCRQAALEMGFSLSEHGLFNKEGDRISADEDRILDTIGMQRSPENR